MLNVMPGTADLTSPVRKVIAKVERYQGSTLVNTFTEKDRVIEVKIERVGDSSKFFGYGICQKVNVRLIDKDKELSIPTGNEFRIYFGTDNTYVSSPIGKYYSSRTCRDEITNELSITAYDKLYKAVDYTMNDLNPNKSYTIRGLAIAISKHLGLNGIEIKELNSNETCFDTNYPEGGNFGGKETLREVLDKIAEATQTIYYVSNDKIIFKRLNKNKNVDLAITRNDYFELDSGDNRRLSKIISATELNDNVQASIPEVGTTVVIRENPFWDLRDDTQILVNNAIAAVGGLTINQFECNWRGNYLLEIGDKISLETKNGTTAISYLLDDTITYNGTFSEISKWHYEPQSENEEIPTTIGERVNSTYAKVDKANKKVDLVAGDVAKLQLAVDGISISYDAASGTASITIGETTVSNLVNGKYVDDTVAAIDLTGYVRFNDLSQKGQTTINGGNITTGTISANRLDLSGEITWSDLSNGAKTEIDNRVDNALPGYLGPTYIDSTIIMSPAIVGGSLQAGTDSSGYVKLSSSGMNFVANNGGPAIGMGYYSNQNNYPYFVLGGGIDSSGTDRGMIKKYVDGIWIGDSDAIHKDRPGGTGLFVNFSGIFYKFVNGVATAF